MAELSSLVVTEKGHTLIGKFIMNGGNGLKLTKVATSSTAYPESALASLISLTGIQQIGEISYMEKYSDTEIRFEASIENSKLTEGYNINTIGVYANDPDDGEILYAVCRALVPGYISAYDGKSVSGATFDLVVKYLITDTETADVYYAMTETERDMFIDLCQSESPTVTEIDTSAYDYKLPESDINMAVSIGQEAYEQYMMNSDPTYQMLELDMRVALLEMGVDLNDISVD